MADILIIDDDPVMCELLGQLMEKINHQSAFGLTGAKGLELAKSGSFDIIFLDVNLPDVNGLDLIQSLKQVSSSPEIIIITGERDPDGAELAITSGAWNYMEKPFFRQEINLQVKRALEFRKEKGRISSSGGLKRHHLIGESEGFVRCLDEAGVAARSKAPVLILGERGTGKTELAKTIHLNSGQWQYNFVVVDCAALNGEIAPEVLFGTGDAKRPGLLTMADQGTLLLDDVEKLPKSVQPQLLQRMAWGESCHDAHEPEKKIPVKIIATTSLLPRELETGDQVSKGLYQALNRIVVRVPELTGRRNDILPLVMYYLDRFCSKYAVPAKGISPECLEIIQAYTWPGNVRELIQAVEKAVATARQEPTLYSIHLPAYIRSGVLKTMMTSSAENRVEPKNGFQKMTLKDFLQEREEDYLSRLYRYTNKDVEKASQIAGISKSGFYKKLKKYKLS